jgi:hypothetical protein
MQLAALKAAEASARLDLGTFCFFSSFANFLAIGLDIRDVQDLFNS